MHMCVCVFVKKRKKRKKEKVNERGNQILASSVLFHSFFFSQVFISFALILLFLSL